MSWQTRRLNNSTKYLLPASMTITFEEEKMKSVRELSQVCSQIVLKCLYLAQIGRPDILWSANKLARLGLSQDSDFAVDLEDSKSTSGGTLCILGSHTFVPISWMCKKQTSVSHSSTESEIISLDAGLRLDGIPALDLWDLIVFVLGNTIQTPDRSGQPVVNGDKRLWIKQTISRNDQRVGEH